MYTAINIHINALQELAQSYDDGELVAEVHELSYDSGDDRTSDILHNFWLFGDLPNGDRKFLEQLYVLAWMEDCFHE